MILWKFAIWILVSPTALYASSDRYSEQTFMVSSQPVRFLVLQDRPVTISLDCVRSGKLDCQAHHVLRQVSVRARPLPQGSEGEKMGSRGEIVCNLYGGVFVRATSRRSNAQKKRSPSAWRRPGARASTRFCRFKDGSMVGLSSLDYYASSSDKY